MSILVTGGAGFIGSHIARALAAQGKSVRIFDNFSTGKEENLEDLAGRVEVIRGDLRDMKILESALIGVTHVYHEAAVGSVPRSIADPFETQTANVNGTLNLLWKAREAGVRRVVIAGSSSVYGDTPGMPRVETLMRSPLSPYALSKLSQELFGKIFTKTYGLETVTLRYFNIFGPYQDPDSEYAAVIPRFIRAILSGEPVTINGTGTQSRDFTYVENAVLANLLAMETTSGIGEAFNVGCGASYSILDLVKNLSEILGISPEIRFNPPRAGDPAASQADISKAKSLLGFEPRVYFREGLERTAEWFLSRWGQSK
ncbi:MAG: SDR family oxidoreductase [Nitrospiraceae bacterium]|nr:SDR family oxidoreductase [Nitrospiraceae bacterium]